MKRWVAGMVGALLPASAIAQAPPAAPAPAATPPQVWQLDWNDNYCAVSTGDPATAGLAVWMTPGDPSPDLIFIGSPKILPPLDDFTKTLVILAPSRGSFSATVSDVADNAQGRVLRLLRLKESFPADFAASSEVRLEGMKKGIVTVGSDKAMAALRQCVDDKLKEWGVDAKAYDALRMPATDPTGRLWNMLSDYPEDALAAHKQGDVIARMDVDGRGRVTNCAVVVSSGTKSLDNATCATALKKGKFTPAIGADGKPTASQRVARMRWRIAGY